MSSVIPPALRRRLPIVALGCVLLLLGGCPMLFGPRMVTPEPPPIPQGGPPVPESNEIVLADDTQIVADAPFGRIKIEAGPGLRRVFTWNGLRRGAIMQPRETRFAGSLGIIFDGKPAVWKPANGVTRLKYEEGQHRFETMDDAMIWMQIRRLNYVYNNQGLAVGWKQKGRLLQVEVWQFYIDGEQPTSMPDADDDAITVAPLKVVPQQMSPQVAYRGG